MNIGLVAMRIGVRRTMIGVLRTGFLREGPQRRIGGNDEMAQERFQHASRLVVRHDPDTNSQTLRVLMDEPF